MNQRKPLAERHPELLRIKDTCEREARSENSLRQLADQEFMRSLSQLEHTLAGDTSDEANGIEELEGLPIETVFPELEDLADAVADIEAYIQGQAHSDNN